MMARAHKAAVMGPKGSGIVKRVALGLVHYLQRSYVKYSWSQDPRIGWFLRRNLFSPHNSLHSGSVILTSGERERKKKKEGCVKSDKWVKAQTHPGQGSQGAPLLKPDGSFPEQ